MYTLSARKSNSGVSLVAKVIHLLPSKHDNSIAIAPLRRKRTTATRWFILYIFPDYYDRKIRKSNVYITYLILYSELQNGLDTMRN